MLPGKREIKNYSTNIHQTIFGFVISNPSATNEKDKLPNMNVPSNTIYAITTHIHTHSHAFGILSLRSHCHYSRHIIIIRVASFLLFCSSLARPYTQNFCYHIHFHRPHCRITSKFIFACISSLRHIKSLPPNEEDEATKMMA